MMVKRNIFRFAAAMMLIPFVSCSEQEIPGGGHSVPEGMVEVRPVLSGMFSSIPRDPSDAGGRASSRAYHDNATTNDKLTTTLRLQEGATVWLIAKGETDNTYVKKSYVVYNSGDESDDVSYLVPCVVNDDGEVVSMESMPLYLKDGQKYSFAAVSPARRIKEEDFTTTGEVAFKVRNGEYFYANDCRYDKTTPDTVTIENSNPEAVSEITLKPMINQTAELRFKIVAGTGVHDLDIQPSGIEVSGLQNDHSVGIDWHMSKSKTDEPIELKHSDKDGVYHQYNYTISDEDSVRSVNIDVPVLPMYSISKPVIVMFRLKVNGVPSSYEMMLNEKDFKAGYSYGYRGTLVVTEGVSVITWQYVSWETDIEFPF